MTEQEAISYIENFTWSTTRLGLGRTRALLAALGDPQKRLKFIHVAGSNGKGSTCAMLEVILRRAGCKTGLYTSPYIQDFCERIQVCGENIPGERLAAITERVRALADAMEDHPSQFELVTAIGMEYFAECGCDIVVLEVGMGGALDSTNAIDAPEIAVITNIGLEHTEYLGSTLPEIAAAKAGIIKSGCGACVCYPSAPEVREVVARACAERGVSFRLAAPAAAEAGRSGLDGQDFRWRGEEYRLALLGPHQIRNAAVVLETVAALRDRGWVIPAEAVRAGLQEVRWPARLEVLNRAPLFLLDGGHNPQCAEALAESVGELLPGKQPVFLTGVLADKDYPAILEQLLPLAREFVCLTPRSPRALSGAALAAALERRGGRAAVSEDVGAGIQTALEAAGESGAVVAFGSLYLAGAVRTEFPSAFRAWLRKTKKRARMGLAAEERRTRSEEIVRHITALPEFRAARTVMIYRAVGGEVSLARLETAAAEGGKRLLYPRCAPGGELLALCPAGETVWEKGSYGIPEPVAESAESVPPEEIDLVLCPCTAFDERGGRLGMGGGYYDRFLPRCKNARIAAAAFEAQKADRIPPEPWDVPMDIVITERGIYRPCRE